MLQFNTKKNKITECVENIQFTANLIFTSHGCGHTCRNVFLL